MLNGKKIIPIGYMESKCAEALRQIDENRYAEPFTNEGYPEVVNYAICFCRKECMVRSDTTLLE